MKKFLFLLCLLPLLGAQQPKPFDKSACTWKGKKLYGKVRIVDSLEDVRIRFVDSLEDFRVRIVDHYLQDRCGLWRYVDSLEDLRVRIVDSGEDLRVRLVDYDPY
jgi:hypothetical protein